MTPLGALLILVGFTGWAITAMQRPKSRARGDWVQGYWVVVFPTPHKLTQWQVWTAPEAWNERALDEILGQATTWSSERAWSDAESYIEENLLA